MNETDDYSRGFSDGYNLREELDDQSAAYSDGYWDGRDQRDRDDDDYEEDDYYEYNEFPEPGEDM